MKGARVSVMIAEKGSSVNKDGVLTGYDTAEGLWD